MPKNEENNEIKALKRSKHGTEHISGGSGHIKHIM
jgi:hypothetical protein